jgi:CheY-like chemotaxis protein
MREAGHDTATASDGADALRVAKTFGHIDLLLTDVNMPEMAGNELARHVRQIEAVSLLAFGRFKAKDLVGSAR